MMQSHSFFWAGGALEVPQLIMFKWLM